ncbi:hypothetical protein UA08_02475 [Talaromyces atroroseus]|uniref:Uncharacterized protein n=1 Tax=Talaromyces atroroseus TaxID=1441469 RepID=A0A225AV36_TALAT|nr:hypothetical protein UA08_02475 [Talaromyces atroroseus]OKL62244.1 hypothetical protein UA08_02475 [Talaromyces atroroseus]
MGPDTLRGQPLPPSHEPNQQDDPWSSPEQPKLSDSDASLSSDENGSVRPRTVPDAEADRADDVIGISIGRAQNRMKARQTPAEEKSRAIESSGGYFDAIPDPEPRDGEEEEGGGGGGGMTLQYRSQLTEEPEQLLGDLSGPTTPTLATLATLAAAAQVDGNRKAEKSVPKSTKRYSLGLLKSSLSGRRRAMSGDSNYSLKFKKLLPDFNLSPNRQHHSPTKADSPAMMRSRSASTPQGAAGPDIESAAIAGSNSSSTSHLNDDGLAALGAIQSSRSHSYHRYPATKKRPPLTVRHSVSDESLYLRSLSRVSTLDHRPHYENVHSMVNSRYKAIKDSLQDSSSRIFSMPSFNLPDFRHEWHPGRFLGDYQRKDNVLGDGSSRLENSAAEVNGNADSSAATSTAHGNFKSNTRQNSIYPGLDEVASTMTGDVVVMGGYRGSILRSAKPPHRQLWVPMKVGLNIRKVDLEVGLTHEDEERMEESIIAKEVLSHIGPVDICRRLLQRFRKFEKLRNGAIRVWDYGYDWRLSPHLLSKRLIQYLEGLPCNAPGVSPEKRGAYVIAHSLGGLITRHAVNQRPDLFAGVVFAGTPQHCVNILGPLRDGDEVLLSSKVLTAQVNFTIRTSYALLPDDGRCFINKDTKEEYLVDFFDVKNWDEYALSPCIRPALPPSGGENKKGLGLIDNLPNSLSTLPKIGLGKRISVKLNGSKTKDPSFSSPVSPQKPQTAREKEQARHVPGHNDEEKISKPSALVTGQLTGGSVGGIIGPNTARTHNTTNVNSQLATGVAASTIPREDAIAYLDRTLKEVRQFRQELAHNESHQDHNRYPPFAVMYSKALPTVYGARVASRDDIKRSDAYDDLAFAAGDGVCLASAAMLPPGYRVIKHGLVKSDRGHVGLLGDLEGAGQCILALVRGREAGVGLGAYAPLSTGGGKSD